MFGFVAARPRSPWTLCQTEKTLQRNGVLSQTKGFAICPKSIRKLLHNLQRFTILEAPLPALRLPCPCPALAVAPKRPDPNSIKVKFESSPPLAFYLISILTFCPAFCLRCLLWHTIWHFLSHNLLSYSVSHKHYGLVYRTQIIAFYLELFLTFWHICGH